MLDSNPRARTRLPALIAAELPALQFYVETKRRLSALCLDAEKFLTAGFVILSSAICIAPGSPTIDADIDALPSHSGVYALHLESAVPHLSSCAFLRARVRRLIAGAERFRERVLRIDCWPSSSRLETWLLLLGLAEQFFPGESDSKLRLRRPWFVALSGGQFPRLLVLNRLPADMEGVYGPFPSRESAAAYAESAGGLFQIRKCPDPLVPAPDHPGCIYGEMHQCLRPCQCVVSDSEYASETARVSDFLRTNGNATRSSLLLARERAAEDLDFEAASQAHKRLERLAVATALREDPAGLLNGFGGVAITKSVQPGCVRLWPMHEAAWLEPLDVDVDPATAENRSLDSRVRESVSAAFPAAPALAVDRSAHLAILLRWYRSSYRDGEWVQNLPGKGISYRKMVAAISRTMKQ